MISYFLVALCFQFCIDIFGVCVFTEHGRMCKLGKEVEKSLGKGDGRGHQRVTEQFSTLLASSHRRLLQFFPFLADLSSLAVGL